MISYSVGSKRYQKPDVLIDIINRIESTRFQFGFLLMKYQMDITLRNQSVLTATHVHQFYTKRNLIALLSTGISSTCCR